MYDCVPSLRAFMEMYQSAAFTIRHGEMEIFKDHLISGFQTLFQLHANCTLVFCKWDVLNHCPNIEIVRCTLHRCMHLMSRGKKTSYGFFYNLFCSVLTPIIATCSLSFIRWYGIPLMLSNWTRFGALEKTASLHNMRGRHNQIFKANKYMQSW